MRDAVILDVDGTLANVNDILDYLDESDPNLHRFHKESVNCPPNDWVVDEAVKAYESGLSLLVVTARVFTYSWETEFWLRKHLPAPYEQLYMRADGDWRPDGIIKREIHAKIVEDGYNVVHAWDDNPFVIEVWNDLGIPVTRVGNWDGH